MVQPRTPGLKETDEIVMISLYKWNSKGVHLFLFYRSPAGPVTASNMAFTNNEKSILNDFHVAIQDCQVLTGYNTRDSTSRVSFHDCSGWACIPFLAIFRPSR
ncbi:hypothetical protein JTE90_022601 [Oedothorax gibbosus]|uniref:Uncharacterized protein n=1 Tax=Oedothorax gibbosus TaxID=931172 RepID=A0AAV6TTT2_9ARAC|nr:hypothetical protein JTE90_022601 [Oedothorax gibbosus]